MLKLRDEELRIRGVPPGPDAKGGKAGVSVNDWLKGADPDDVTQVQSSYLRFGGLDTGKASVGSFDGSPFLGFAEHFAKVIADARGTPARWSSEMEGKDKEHIATFE